MIEGKERKTNLILQNVLNNQDYRNKGMNWTESLYQLTVVVQAITPKPSSLKQ